MYITVDNKLQKKIVVTLGSVSDSYGYHDNLLGNGGVCYALMFAVVTRVCAFLDIYPTVHLKLYTLL